MFKNIIKKSKSLYMTSSNEKKWHENLVEKLKDPVVLGGILVIIILIVVAVMMWQKQHNSTSAFTETATKYLLTNTPQLLAFE